MPLVKINDTILAKTWKQLRLERVIGPSFWYSNNLKSIFYLATAEVLRPLN